MCIRDSHDDLLQVEAFIFAVSKIYLQLVRVTIVFTFICSVHHFAGGIAMSELQRRTTCDEIAQCQSREARARSGLINLVECQSQCNMIKVLRSSSHPEKSLHVLVFIKFLCPVQRRTATQLVDDQS